MDQTAYQVFASPEIATSVMGSGSLWMIQSQFHVAIQYMNGMFIIYRGQADVTGHQQAKHELIRLIKTASAPTWYRVVNDDWLAFSQDTAADIQAAYRGGTPALLSIQSVEFEFNFGDMIARNTQSNEYTQLYRQTQGGRAPRPPHEMRQFRSAPGRFDVPKTIGVTWSYIMRKRNKTFPQPISQALEKAYPEGESISIRMGKDEFVVDFQEMKMVNKRNQKEVPISRASTQVIQVI